MITGTTTSRLVELKKYKEASLFIDKYRPNGSINNDGVDYIHSDENIKIEYYIDGIKYVDILDNDIFSNYVSGQTIQIYMPEGITPNNFIDVRYVKNINKTHIVNSSKIINDVFIDRSEIGVFESIYRLEYIENLGDLITYVGGNFFKIINNK